MKCLDVVEDMQEVGARKDEGCGEGGDEDECMW